MREISEIQRFIEGWRDVVYLPSSSRQSDFIQSFSRFRDEYIQNKEKTERISLIRAPGYNIFSLLGVSRDEVKYSSFLANLLDPFESHGQGTLFLHSFLEYCSKRNKDFPFTSQDLNQGRWSTVCEMGINAGRLDIAVMNPALGALILIENKVDANEQNAQLERYGKWMERMKSDFPMQALIFLNVTGYEAATSGGYIYYRFSYHEDVPAWLEPVIEQIQAPGVREVVRQYLEIVHAL